MVNIKESIWSPFRKKLDKKAIAGLAPMSVARHASFAFSKDLLKINKNVRMISNDARVFNDFLTITAAFKNTSAEQAIAALKKVASKYDLQLKVTKVAASYGYINCKFIRKYKVKITQKVKVVK